MQFNKTDISCSVLLSFAHITFPITNYITWLKHKIFLFILSIETFQQLKHDSIIVKYRTRIIYVFFKTASTLGTKKDFRN